MQSGREWLVERCPLGRGSDLHLVAVDERIARVHSQMRRGIEVELMREVDGGREDAGVDAVGPNLGVRQGVRQGSDRQLGYAT